MEGRGKFRPFTPRKMVELGWRGWSTDQDARNTFISTVLMAG